MAAIRERTTFTLEEVSGFPAISVEGNGSIDENHESAGEESDSSAESEGDRWETIRNQQQER